MRKSTISKSQRLEILATWDAGAKVEDLCRRYQISAATLYGYNHGLLILKNLQALAAIGYL
jgi:Mor family transcriptional regulator